MKEKEIEKILVEEVKRLGGKAYKWTSPGNVGVPDRIIILPNRKPIFVELKMDTGKLSALQSIQCDRLKKLGQEVYITYGIKGISQMFRGIGFVEVSKKLDCRFGL